MVEPEDVDGDESSGHQCPDSTDDDEPSVPSDDYMPFVYIGIAVGAGIALFIIIYRVKNANKRLTKGR